jgi:hypothetical protein
LQGRYPFHLFHNIITSYALRSGELLWRIVSDREYAASCGYIISNVNRWGKQMDREDLDIETCAFFGDG